MRLVVCSSSREVAPQAKHGGPCSDYFAFPLRRTFLADGPGLADIVAHVVRL